MSALEQADWIPEGRILAGKRRTPLSKPAGQRKK
jgi:hypothetical protein